MLTNKKFNNGSSTKNSLTRCAVVAMIGTSPLMVPRNVTACRGAPWTSECTVKSRVSVCQYEAVVPLALSQSEV